MATIEEVQRRLALAQLRARLEAAPQQPAAATTPFPKQWDWEPAEAAAKAGPNLQQSAQQAFGFKKYAERGTVLPLGKTNEGKLEMAWPQAAVDMASSALLPSQVAQGLPYTPEDVSRFAVDFGLPFTGATRMPRSAITKNAPTTDQLFKGGGAGFQSAEAMGVAVKPDRYLDLLIDIEKKIGDDLDQTLHPTSTAVFGRMLKKLDQSYAPDLGELQKMRRQIGLASGTTKPELADERRIAAIMRDRLDDMIESLTPADVVAGDPTHLARTLGEARMNWSRARKSEMIEQIMSDAEISATGYENGLRVGFRQLLKNQKLLRGFQAPEIGVMREIASGGPITTRALRILGKFGFGSRGSNSWLGGVVGAGVGHAAGDAVTGTAAGAGAGTALVPIAAYAAQKALAGAAERRAKLVRALAATGGELPSVWKRRLDTLLKGAAPATAGALTMPSQSY